MVVDMFPLSFYINRGQTAHMLSPELKSVLPEAFFCKGNYFALTGVKNPFKHLVYPIPNSAGLGVHVTLDMNGIGTLAI